MLLCECLYLICDDGRCCGVEQEMPEAVGGVDGEPFLLRPHLAHETLRHARLDIYRDAAYLFELACHTHHVVDGVLILVDGVQKAAGVRDEHLRGGESAESADDGVEGGEADVRTIEESRQLRLMDADHLGCLCAVFADVVDYVMIYNPRQFLVRLRRRCAAFFHCVSCFAAK